MADLILPGSFEMPELSHPGRQPVGNVKIDWDHPLARGLTSYIIRPFKHDLVTDIDTVVSGGAVEIISNKGKILDCDNVNAHIRTSSILDRQKSPEGTTIFVGKIVSAGVINQNPTLFGIVYDTANNTPWVSLQLVRRAGGNVNLLYNDNGTFRDISSGAYTLDEYVVYAGTVKSGKAKVYQNGIEKASSALASTIQYTATSFIAFGGGHNTAINQNAGDEASVGMLYNRALIDSEIFSISKNPYQVLIPV